MDYLLNNDGKKHDHYEFEKQWQHDKLSLSGRYEGDVFFTNLTVEKYRVHIAKFLSLGLGLKKSEWKGQIIADIGCGPHPVSLFFEDATLICIDPLADFYAQYESSFVNHPCIEKLISKPAEEKIEYLGSYCDMVVSFNVLDHTEDWLSVLDNMSYYLKPNGKIILCTDHSGRNGTKPTEGHSRSFTREELIIALLNRDFQISTLLSCNEDDKKCKNEAYHKAYAHHCLIMAIGPE